MRRLILDTTLYLDWLNTGAHVPLLFQPYAVNMMSAVVMMELLAGAYAVRDRTRLHDLFSAMDLPSYIQTGIINS